MIEAAAEVLRADGGRVRVRMLGEQGGCGRCHEPGGCRSVALTQALGTRLREFELTNTIGAVAGDRVRLVMEDGGPLRAALASYGLATVCVLAGGAAGLLLYGQANDGAIALGAGAGLLSAIAVNRMLVRSRRWRAGLRLELAKEGGTCRHPGVAP